MNEVEDTGPAIRTFFTIPGLDYEFGQYEVTGVVSQLISAGAATITINRVIIDDNAPPPEPVDPQLFDEDAEVISDDSDI